MTTAFSPSNQVTVLLEKLHNLRQLQVTIPHATLEGKDAEGKLVANPAVQPTIQITKSNLYIALPHLTPSPFLLPLCADLKPQTQHLQHTAEYTTLRSTYIIDRSEDETDAFPTANELDYRRMNSLACRQCGQRLIQQAQDGGYGIKRCLPLPSLYWHEIVDMWYCHTAGPPPERIGTAMNSTPIDMEVNGHDHSHGEHDHAHSQPVIGGQNIVSQPSLLLLGVTHALLHFSDLNANAVAYTTDDSRQPTARKLSRSTQPNQDVEERKEPEPMDATSNNNIAMREWWCWLHCKGCHDLLGEVEVRSNEVDVDGTYTNAKPTGQTRLQKHALWAPAHISIDSNLAVKQQHPSAATLANPAHNVLSYYRPIHGISEDLLQAAHAHVGYKFSIRSVDIPTKLLQLVILNWETAIKLVDSKAIELSQTKPMTPAMLPALKVMYSVKHGDASEEIDNWLDDSEEMLLHRTEVQQLIIALETSNAMLPPSLATLDSMKLAYLPRLTRKDIDKAEV